MVDPPLGWMGGFAGAEGGVHTGGGGRGAACGTAARIAGGAVAWPAVPSGGDAGGVGAAGAGPGVGGAKIPRGGGAAAVGPAAAAEPAAPAVIVAVVPAVAVDVVVGIAAVGTVVSVGGGGGGIRLAGDSPSACAFGTTGGADCFSAAWSRLDANQTPAAMSRIAAAPRATQINMRDRLTISSRPTSKDAAPRRGRVGSVRAWVAAEEAK